MSVLSTSFSYEIQNTTLYQLLGRKLTLSQTKPGKQLKRRRAVSKCAWSFAAPEMTPKIRLFQDMQHPKHPEDRESHLMN